ncbi:hypothetical protein CVT26_004365 [Gymnopilus dilepis]|uniref:Uncharacterized protein n=1 Tax=Gymnopilus dilepis TaxID=231916 RepID=A0A409W6R9_9AGAR|nr:hypothetical protein CVT26_004365 [Gymnopilus dilepis]
MCEDPTEYVKAQINSSISLDPCTTRLDMSGVVLADNLLTELRRLNDEDTMLLMKLDRRSSFWGFRELMDQKPV